MGRSFGERKAGREGSLCQMAKSFKKHLKKEGPSLRAEASEMAKKHSSEAFYALDDPMEAAVFSVLLEMVKEMDKGQLAKMMRMESRVTSLSRS